jgi:hypothetical protein
MKRFTFAGCAIAVAALFAGTAVAGDIQVVQSEIPTHPSSIVPGTLDLNGDPVVTRFKAIEDFAISPDGSAWILKGRSLLGSELEGTLLLGAGMSGDMFAQEGRPFAGGEPGELYDFFDSNANPASFNTLGDIAFSARARGGLSSIKEKLVYYNAVTGMHTIRLTESSPAFGLLDLPPNPTGDELIGNSIGSVHLRDDGMIGFANTPLQNCHSSRYPAVFLEDKAIRQSGVSTVEGLLYDDFDYDDCGGSADGNYSFFKALLDSGTADDRILAINGRIVLREGSNIGQSNVVMADVFYTYMRSNGDWFSRGDDPNDDDWAVAGGELVAATGDEIGSTGEFLGDSFLAFNGNRVGDWVLVANTDNPNPGRDTVVLLNGEVVLREGDPIDLDGNGQFDDDVFIGRGNNTLTAFAANDVFLTDGRMLYFIAPLRDEAGNDLGSDPPFGAGGEAFMRVQLAGGCDPCDANCDGVVDAFDIEPFITLLTGGGSGCAPCTGDVNGDGAIDAFDIEPFIECLVGP